MKTWMNNMNVRNKMGNLDKSIYEQQIANMVAKGLKPEQADYLQDYLDNLKK